MHLQKDENYIKNVHHHPVVFILRALKIAIVSLPFYLVAAFFSGVLSGMQMFLAYLGIFTMFGLIMFYDLILFYLDRLIITNRRIVHIDWKSIFNRTEHEAELVDIQDIATEEAGIFSAIPIFDFGTFRLETASTKTTIIFKDAPDPEGIKNFIYHLNLKPNRIGGNITLANDPARQIYDEEAAVIRRQ